MRLGQLARKLSVKPGEISALLEKSNIVVEPGSNTKLSEESVRLVVQQLAPDMLSVILNMPEEEPTMLEPEAVTEETAEPVVEEVAEPEEETETAGLQEYEEIEVIRAPKVELPGLKVVGKIELPEPKKKEESAIEEGEVARDEVRATRRDGRRDQRRSYPRKNSAVLQREREEREAKKRKELEEAREKQKRTENYKRKRVAEVKTTKKKSKKVATVQTVRPEIERPEPTSVIGKFRKWLFRE